MEKVMPTAYLVTGCAGLIGARVTQMLLDRGETVVGIDNLNDAYDPCLKEWRLNQFVSHEHFTFHRIDITDRGQLDAIFEAAKAPFACVINLGARAGVRASVENPWIYYETNTTGTLNLLECCRRSGTDKFVLASTSSAYGGLPQLPYREGDDVTRPLSPYAASKLAAETLCHTYYHLHGLDITVLRYFTVYGPAGRPDMAVFRFVRQISEGETITVYGDGTQGRDFTYVDDIARGTILAGRPMGYEIINLGGDRPVALCDVIDQIAALTGRTPNIRYEPAHPADVKKTWACIDKAKQLLQWSPEVPLEEGLASAVQWYQENHELAISVKL